MRSSWSAGACALGFVVVSASCSSFSEDEPPSTVDASTPDAVGPDGAPSDAGTDDGSSPDGGSDSLRAPCPPPNAGTGIPTSWSHRQLFAPASPERMYPFAIATDASSVTWLAQVGTTDAGDDTLPYNGSGKAVVMRAAKLGGGKPTIIARDQPLAVALALDGPYAYWTTYEQSVATLRRQRRDADCEAGCALPESVTTFGAGIRVVRLVRPAPGVLFAHAEDGRLFRVDLSSTPAPVLITQSGKYPGLAATSEHVFTSAGLSDKVQRSPVDGKTPSVDAYLSFPAAPDGGRAGVSPIATDCTTLWMTRVGGAAGSDILSHTLATPRSLDTLKTLPAGIDVFDLGADRRFVYVAAANAGGVYAVETSSGTVSQPYSGNVFRLAVDDDGVYFGEHAPGANPGRLFMLVKN